MLLVHALVAVIATRRFCNMWHKYVVGIQMFPTFKYYCSCSITVDTETKLFFVRGAKLDL